MPTPNDDTCGDEDCTTDATKLALGVRGMIGPTLEGGGTRDDEIDADEGTVELGGIGVVFDGREGPGVDVTASSCICRCWGVGGLTLASETLEAIPMWMAEVDDPRKCVRPCDAADCGTGFETEPALGIGDGWK